MRRGSLLCPNAESLLTPAATRLFSRLPTEDKGVTHHKRLVLGFAAALLSGGCGTVNNLTRADSSGEGGAAREPRPRIYGGVRGEWSELKAMRFDDVYCFNLIWLPLYALD